MKLFEPLDVGGMTIPNRIMVPAMVTRLSGEDGRVNQDIADRYVRYAQGGTGLIVVEAMAIHGFKAGPLLRISDDEFVPGLRALVQRVHDCSEAKIVPQLIHFMKISRSGWRQTVDMLSLEEIDRIVEQFGDAAARARTAGFDGAELHSAHAYTLASFLSRCNPRRDEYSGETLEGRLRLLGRVMENVRSKAGPDFPVGVRFVVDEFIKGGYTVEDAKLIALRAAQLGAAYVSLSAGGKFEDAVHEPGHVPYPYTGFSGDRCMPGDWYPMGLHAGMAREVKRFLSGKGFRTAVAAAGKLSDPDDAERVVSDGTMDIVAIARGLLADPDWPSKVQRGARDRIVQCDYCNVCKHLDGTHMKVVCFLWPKGALQAPPDDPSAAAPAWGEDQGGLTVKLKPGIAELKWAKAGGDPAHYDIYRADDEGDVRVVDGVKTTWWQDKTILAGMRYRYYVRACNAAGGASPPSRSVGVAPALAASATLRSG
jgi:2,4-dienoyl-CoA reductase-like NADH-dependent reductase (Old Yellow Enzyme family)